MDGENISTYDVGDKIRISNQTYKKPVAQITGYEFKWSHEGKTTGLDYWQCVNYNRNHVARCSAVIYTNGEEPDSEIMEIKNVHNHACDAVANERRARRNVGRQIDVSIYLIYAKNTFAGQFYKACVVILTSRRTIRNYEYALRKLVECESHFDPSKIVMDFEQAPITAFKNVFPDIEIDGCFFHLGWFANTYLIKEEFVLSINAAAGVDRRVQMSKYQKISADLQRFHLDFMAGNTTIIRFLTLCAKKIKFGRN
uniref:MULE transposase domain-containing protein n=1 Tax=Panagrolaimus davidi TaxID=227884 RepID=A0A914R429_9BILA